MDEETFVQLRSIVFLTMRLRGWRACSVGFDGSGDDGSFDDLESPAYYGPRGVLSKTKWVQRLVEGLPPASMLSNAQIAALEEWGDWDENTVLDDLCQALINDLWNSGAGASFDGDGCCGTFHFLLEGQHEDLDLILKEPMIVRELSYYETVTVPAPTEHY